MYITLFFLLEGELLDFVLEASTALNFLSIGEVDIEYKLTQLLYLYILISYVSIKHTFKHSGTGEVKALKWEI